MLKGISLEKAFSLMEILIAVIIVGVIASIALVSYSSFIERQKLQEGVNILNEIYKRAKAARLEYDYTYTAGNCPSFSQIGVVIPHSDSFGTPTYSCSFPGFYIVTLARNGNLYRLQVMDAYGGTGYPFIACSSATGICNKIGLVEALIPF